MHDQCPFSQLSLEAISTFSDASLSCNFRKLLICSDEDKLLSISWICLLYILQEHGGIVDSPEGGPDVLCKGFVALLEEESARGPPDCIS